MSTVEIKNAKAPFDPDCSHADVILRSSDLVDFHVLKTLLAFSSPFFASMFSLPQNPAGPNAEETKNGLQIVQMSEDSRVLYYLLQFCYPMHAMREEREEPKTLEETWAIVEVSRKYEMPCLEDRMRDMLVDWRFLRKKPLQVFALAVKHGLEREARIAVNELLHLPVDSEYIPELEHITGGDHFRMLEHRRACVAAAVAATCKTAAFPMIGPRWVWWECNRCPTEMDVVGRPVAAWFRQYVSAVCDALKDRPCGQTVLEYTLIDTVLKVQQCPGCVKRVCTELPQFRTRVANAVDEATGKVPFNLLVTVTSTES